MCIRDRGYSAAEGAEDEPGGEEHLGPGSLHAA